ncbi:catechol oxidase [Salvia divinorum]|uniref:Catechol oxidase n=1 Tax=Salvia divinorum TaxID=28513 RepID=A0ABD1H6K2_SALDI
MTSLYSPCTVLSTTHPHHRISPPPPPNTRRSRRFLVSCSGGSGDQPKVDRRNMLLGLYGASNLILRGPDASAKPIQPPDFTKCGDARESTTGDLLDLNCCPPVSDSGFVDYKLPGVSRLRRRRAAYDMSPTQLGQYEEAMRRMRALDETDPDDPRGFTQQANIHCAYCNGAHDQLGYPCLDLSVHYSWIFFPFHRWYLYFFERILGSLIDDPDFALPYWNWDNPRGMQFPAIFNNPNSPLYDSFRNQKHVPPAIASLILRNEATDPTQIISENLSIMYNEMIGGVNSAVEFMGQPYRAGDQVPPMSLGGTLERGSHIAIHAWVGDPDKPYNEDLGNFYSAARDPVFFAHHSNVDRLWAIWQGIKTKYQKTILDRDYLDASFLFYDENKQLVRVKAGDCDTSQPEYQPQCTPSHGPDSCGQHRTHQAGYQPWQPTYHPPGQPPQLNRSLSHRRSAAPLPAAAPPPPPRSSSTHLPQPSRKFIDSGLQRGRHSSPNLMVRSPSHAQLVAVSDYNEKLRIYRLEQAALLARVTAWFKENIDDENLAKENSDNTPTMVLDEDVPNTIAHNDGATLDVPNDESLEEIVKNDNMSPQVLDEVYDDKIGDLIDPAHRESEIKDDVETLSEEYVACYKDVTQIQILNKILSNRKIGATKINFKSTRSHIMFTCIMESWCRSNCTDNKALGYEYQKVETPWECYRPRKKVEPEKKKKEKKKKNLRGLLGPEKVFPVSLKEAVRVVVVKLSKGNADDWLVLEEIQTDCTKLVKFDVFVNDEDEEPGELDRPGYAGTYAQLPHRVHSSQIKGALKLSLKELYENIDIGDQESVVVTIVPRINGEVVTIGGVKIIPASR